MRKLLAPLAALVSAAECFSAVPSLPATPRIVSSPASSLSAHADSPLSRRAVLAAVPLLFAAAPASFAKNSAAPPFDGAYSDPKHPGCPRNIAMVLDGDAEGVVEVSGKDGTPGCTGDGPTRPWRLSGKTQGDKILVDFSPKGGPRNLLGQWEAASPSSPSDGIRWPDSNKWSKVSGKLTDL